MRLRWWRCAVFVQKCERLQPASQFVGCWPGEQHGSAPPPTQERCMVSGAARLCTQLTTRHARVLWWVQKMFHSSGFNQPLDAWDVGQVTSFQVRRRPAPQSGLLHTHSCSGERPRYIRGDGMIHPPPMRARCHPCQRSEELCGSKRWVGALGWSMAGEIPGCSTPSLPVRRAGNV